MREHASNRIARKLGAIASAAASIGHYDFCPWANRYVYWLRQPIGWFVAGAFAALLVAVFLAPQGWWLFGVLVAVTILGVAWPWISILGLDARLIFDRGRCREFEPVSIRLAIRNRWPWPAWGLVVEGGFFDPQGQGEPATAVTALARVGGWSQNEYEFTFRPERRGLYPQLPPLLATGFPFGLWLRTRTVAVQGELLVWPQTVALTSVPAMGGDRLTVAGSFVDRAGDDGDLLAVRFYREGDSLRRVHWAQTARRDVLVVCERQATARRRVVVALDETAFVGSAADDVRQLDWAVRVLATVCRELHAHHCDVECRLNGQPLLMEAGPVGLRHLLDRLARYRPAPREETRREWESSNSAALMIVVTRGLPLWHEKPRSRAFAAPRLVLIDGGTSAPSPHVAGGAVRPWIALDTSADVVEQLQFQWRRLCHDDWRIN